MRRGRRSVVVSLSNALDDRNAIGVAVCIAAYDRSLLLLPPASFPSSVVFSQPLPSSAAPSFGFSSLHRARGRRICRFQHTMGPPIRGRAFKHGFTSVNVDVPFASLPAAAAHAARDRSQGRRWSSRACICMPKLNSKAAAEVHD